MLGKLSWAAIPFNEPLPLLSGAVVWLQVGADPIDTPLMCQSRRRPE